MSSETLVLNAICSLYKRATKPYPIGSLTVSEILDNIRTGVYKKDIEAVRKTLATAGKEAYTAHKKFLLKGVTFQGTFKRRSNNALQQSTGLFIVDFDNLENPCEVKKRLATCPYVVACFISPSNDGLKVVVRIPFVKNDKEYKRVFAVLKAYFSEQFTLTLDESGKDISRLCFVSYDRQIYVNPNAQEFPVSADVLNPPIVEEPPKVEPKQQSEPKQKRQTSHHEQSNVFQRELDRDIDTLKRMVSEAPKKSQHTARLKAGKLAGGIVAGYASSLTSEDELVKIILSHDKGVDRRAVEKTIRDGLTYGKHEPKTADDVLKKWEDWKATHTRQKEETQNVRDKRTLAAHEFISDLHLEYQDGLQWEIGETGTGKTQETCRYADEHEKEMVLLVTPTTGICEQTARSLKEAGKPFQLVLQSESFNYDITGLTVTTLASFVKKFNFSECLYPVALFIDEAHGLSEDIYRQADISTLYDMLSGAQKVIFMTATPHFHHNHGLQAAPKIVIEKEGKEPTRCHILYYEKDEYAVIRHFAEKGRLIAELNTKKGIRRYKRALEKQGFTGVCTLSSDEKHVDGSTYQYIVEHERLPDGCQILLTTKLYETGLNIRDTDIKTVLTFPVKPLDVRRYAEAVLTPHALKQVANRTRKATPDIFYCLPSCMKNDRDVNFDGEYHYNRLKERAEEQRQSCQKEIDRFGFNGAIMAFYGEFREHTARLITFENDTPYVSEAGLDMAVCEQYQKSLLFSGMFLRSELDKHGLKFDGELNFSELTEQAECTAEENDTLTQAKIETAEELHAEFVEELDRLSVLTDKELGRDESKHAHKLAFLRKVETNDNAVKLLEAIGTEPKAFSQVKSRLTIVRAMATGAKKKRRIETAKHLRNFLRQHKEFTGNDAKQLVTRIFKTDPVLRYELDPNGKSLSEKRALAVLRKFTDIHKKHTENGNVYTQIEQKPLVKLWQKATGHTPLESEFLRFWLFSKNESDRQTLTGLVSEPADTLNFKAFIESEISTCQGIVEYIATELTDFAEEQLATFGKVF